MGSHESSSSWIILSLQLTLGSSPALSTWGALGAIHPDFLQLTHWSLVVFTVSQNCVNFDSGNGLVPDSTKPLPEPKLMWYITNEAVAFTCGKFHTGCYGIWMSITDKCLVILQINLQFHLPGINELSWISACVAQWQYLRDPGYYSLSQ